MRSKDRIDPFLKRLGDVWRCVPDWRFGQLMVNVLGSMPRDPFFPEEDEMIEYFEKFMEEHGYDKR